MLGSSKVRPSLSQHVYPSEVVRSLEDRDGEKRTLRRPVFKQELDRQFRVLCEARNLDHRWRQRVGVRPKVDARYEDTDSLSPSSMLRTGPVPVVHDLPFGLNTGSRLGSFGDSPNTTLVVVANFPSSTSP